MGTCKEDGLLLVHADDVHLGESKRLHVKHPLEGASDFEQWPVEPYIGWISIEYYSYFLKADGGEGPVNRPDEVYLLPDRIGIMLLSIIKPSSKKVVEGIWNHPNHPHVVVPGVRCQEDDFSSGFQNPIDLSEHPAGII